MKLEIKNLCAGYDGDVVLHDVNLSVEEGEFISLLGPSGCGKTTLMKTIAGILPVRSGTLRMDGADISGLPIHKRGTVIVFQDMRIFPHLTVVENVAFPLKMQGVGKEERLHRAQKYLEKVQMADFVNRKSGELSGGQQQRVALARALAAKPKLLLLDEPFSALDENLREDMRTLVMELKREFGMTVILVTHDREEALSMSDRVALLFDGQIAQEGTPREVYSWPVSRQAANYFGGWVSIPGQVTGGIFTGAAMTASVKVPDGAYEMLVRSDAFVIDKTGEYKASVKEIRFRGNGTLVTLCGEDGTCWRQLFSKPPELQVGQEITLRLRLDDAVLFCQ